MIAGTLNDYLILTPLIKEIRKNKGFTLTLVSTRHHKNSEMDIFHRQLEEEGFLIDEKTDIVLSPAQALANPCRPDFGDLEYSVLFGRLQPDIIILCRNSCDTLAAAIAASQYGIPLVHIQGGESGYGTWDDSYGYGITKLSHLHFTAAQKYKEQVIGFGEHPGRVFNVGSLLAEQVKNLAFQDKSHFFNMAGMDNRVNFLLVSFTPDPNLGSKNSKVFENLLTSLTSDGLKDYQLLFNRAEQKGLGKMINTMIDDFMIDEADRAFSLPDMNLTDLSCAVRYCSAVIGNSSQVLTIAPTLKKPMVNIGARLQDREKSGHIIDSTQHPLDILTAVQNGLSAEFNFKIQHLDSPFEKQSTARKMCEILASFDPAEIAAKAYYADQNCSLMK